MLRVDARNQSSQSADPAATSPELLRAPYCREMIRYGSRIGSISMEAIASDAMAPAVVRQLGATIARNTMLSAIAIDAKSRKWMFVSPFIRNAPQSRAP